MSNLHYLFHKAYYDKITDIEEKKNTYFEKCNKKLTSSIVIQPFVQIPDTSAFTLQTAYPGLLVGIGNLHQSGTGDEEIKLGFSLDYVTGMPYIPGSTVKGCLRSPFQVCPEYIQELLMTLDHTLANVNIKTLEYAIFGESIQEEETGDIEIPGIGQRDVFLDAVLAEEGNQKEILALDYITPHIHKEDSALDGLTEPIPLKMLKVPPKVKFIFRFILHDSKHISAMQKLELFKMIIKDLGVGAKTNVGYGVMQEPSELIETPSAASLQALANQMNSYKPKR